MKVLLEAKCAVCGERRLINPEDLVDEDADKRIESIRCPECENILVATEHLRALGGFLSAVGNKRKHVAAAFHAAKILISILEKQHLWKFKVCVIAERTKAVAKPVEAMAACSEEVDYL